jgi:hypothetical protein
MKKFTFPLVVLLLFLLVSISEAGSISYKCIIKHVYDVDDLGELKVSNFQNQFENNTFSVSVETGEINGEVLTTILANRTAVINSGSTKNSFKAIAEFEGQIQLIEIQIFKDGKFKPFVATSMGGAGLVTGTCSCN